MAKKSVKKAVNKAEATTSPPAAPVVIDPFGPTEQRRVVRSKVTASEFVLDDGTKLVIKPIVGDIRRAVGQFNDKGQPLYFLAAGGQIETIAPRNLLQVTVKRPAKKRK